MIGTILKSQVISVCRELSGEGITKFMNDVNRRIFELVHSQDSHEKMGGILAIDRLVELESEENTTKITRFANYLRNALPGSDPTIMALAARALGHLVYCGGTLTADIVEFEVKRSLDWLNSERNEAKRHAAVFVLKELAINAPTIMYSYVAQFFNLIWVSLRDSKLIIRESAAEALSAFLDIVQKRESSSKHQWYKRLVEEMQKGLRQTVFESLHGSLLALNVLLDKTGDFMKPYFVDTCETVLRLKDSRDVSIRKIVMKIIPQLAQFQPSEFVDRYLKTSMQYLLAVTKKEKYSFFAIGQISLAVRSSMGPYLDSIFAHIKDSLHSKSSKSKGAIETDAVFQCLGMLAKAVGPAVSDHIRELIDAMFSGGLTYASGKSLVDIGESIPSLLPLIQERLLDNISVTLSGQAFKPPGSVDRGLSVQESQALRELQISETKDVDTFVLALKTLATFDFTGHSLNFFVRECVVGYLEDDSPEIRKAAALCCGQLLVKDPIQFQKNSYYIRVVREVLEKLLMVGIADTHPEIRQAVLNSLDDRFDQHLCQPENIRSLFIALNDEVFSIRESAIEIIGRLTALNPAYVLPSLRKTLIQLLTELEYSVISRKKEECARILGLLVKASQRLIQPYVEPIFKVLMPKLKDPSPGVSAQVLLAVGELAEVGREELIPYLDDLTPILIETIQDQSSAGKREAALRALGQLAANTGFVIEPYLKYPKLLAILMSILKTEQVHSIRKEAVKLLGILGALDPYRHKMALFGITETEDSPEVPSSDSVILAGPSQSEDYYPTVAINALVKILSDPSLSIQHTAVVQAIMYIFKTLGLKAVQYLPQIMPPLLNMMKVCPTGLLEFHFQQLGLLISIVKGHIRNYLPELLALVQDHWSPESNIQKTILVLIESIALALENDFKIYLPRLLSHILLLLESDTDPKRQLSLKVLHALTVFGSNLEEYLHLVIPALVKEFEKPDVPLNVRRAAIQAVGRLSRKVDFTDYASRIIHPLFRVLQQQSHHELRNPSMDTICSLILQLQDDFVIFIPMLNKVMLKNKIHHRPYELLISRLLKHETLPQEMGFDLLSAQPESSSEESLIADVSAAKKLPVNQQNLKKAWEASQRSTRDDWMEWMRRLSVELLKESPSHALRACASLASTYTPLASELFNAAFVSCWTELYDQFQDELVRSLELALVSTTIPPEILQTLLNLAEFMEHDDKALPIDQRTLGAYAAKCHAYAKALRYKELEFMNEPLPETIEALISINNQLQQPDAAIGILKHAQQKHDIELKESWYEKLQRWEDALDAYNKRQKEDPNNISVTLGRMRCLHALGEWDQLSELAQQKWFDTSTETRKLIAPLAAAAAWGLGQWELMDDYIAEMRTDSLDGAFFRAILEVHRNHFDKSADCIDKTLDLLDTELKALVGESYSRAYNAVVRVQMLTELEEIVTYKKFNDVPERLSSIRNTWMKRLSGCEHSVEVWQRILKIRSLVVNPRDDMSVWIKFAQLCRDSGRSGLSSKILTDLLGQNQLTEDYMKKAPPLAVYSYLKHIWGTGRKQEALQSMRKFTHSLLELVNQPQPKTLPESANLKQQHQSSSSGFSRQMAHQNPVSNDNIIDDSSTKEILAKCYLKLGDWQNSLEERWDEESLPEILNNYSQATKYNGNWYKAWHAWALANFEIISHFEKMNDDLEASTPMGNNAKQGDEAKKMPKQKLQSYVIPSIKGFFKSIALSQGNSLQDTLRLLTLWFKYGHHHDVYTCISEGFSSVSVDTWLQVIPQLIARIHAPSPPVRRLNHQLLSEIGKEHPQALIYSLTVASKSQSNARKNSALAILDKMRTHSSKSVEQALLVSQELIRVAILWHEMWHEGLEEASRLYFGEHNIKAMFQVLEPLHKMMERGPQTLREISFNQNFGRDLQEAQEWGKKYQQTQKENDLHQAWDLYYHVFRRINKQLPQLTTLELQYVSPKLLEAEDLELAVPGSYRSGEPVVRISQFSHQLSVITSKQRPRKLTIKGSDGRDYQYLLKGHEDLRQDERVMQLFGLVNTLLSVDPETFKRHLNIQRFPVIPLSPNSGLIGWVPHCDTLHSLIREYRDHRKVTLNIEHRLMLQMAPDYDNLTLMQKIEVFQHALDQTNGQDLAQVLWMKSRTSEVWLDRRTNYVRSLAVMSMVGYILGLGDRHPSNLMLDRQTGKIIHIDFGDCFEVAMQREKFPEKIPFRLTRMLVNAMEVCGIEGSFRTTCEHVMQVLRSNKESLMAVLEAFVYDPLINWRLFGGGAGATAEPSTSAAPAPTAPVSSTPDASSSVSQASKVPGNNRLSFAQTLDLENSLKKYHEADNSSPANPAPNQDEDFIGTRTRFSADYKPEALNTKALAVIKRVQNKLTGKDFIPTTGQGMPKQPSTSAPLPTSSQVDKLINQAMAIENLCQCYIGWCPFW